MRTDVLQCAVPSTETAGSWNDTLVLDWDEDHMDHQHLLKQVKPHFTQLWVSTHSNPLCCDHLQHLLPVLLCQRSTSRDLHTFEASLYIFVTENGQQV